MSEEKIDILGLYQLTTVLNSYVHVHEHSRQIV